MFGSVLVHRMGPPEGPRYSGDDDKIVAALAPHAAVPDFVQAYGVAMPKAALDIPLPQGFRCVIRALHSAWPKLTFFGKGHEADLGEVGRKTKNCVASSSHEYRIGGIYRADRQ